MGPATFLATTLGKVVLGIVGLVVTAGIAGGSLYLMDYGVEATVIDKDCNANTLTVEESFTKFDHTQGVGAVECLAIQRGNFVIYNIQSERIRVWDTDARQNLIWDSEWMGGGGGGGSDGGQSGGGSIF